MTDLKYIKTVKKKLELDTYIWTEIFKDNKFHSTLIKAALVSKKKLEELGKWDQTWWDQTLINKEFKKDKNKDAYFVLPEKDMKIGIIVLKEEFERHSKLLTQEDKDFIFCKNYFDYAILDAPSDLEC